MDKLTARPEVGQACATSPLNKTGRNLIGTNRWNHQQTPFQLLRGVLNPHPGRYFPRRGNEGRVPHRRPASQQTLSLVSLMMHGEIFETMTRQKYRNFLISHGQLSEVEETKIQQKPSPSGWAKRSAQEPAHTTSVWNQAFRVPFLKNRFSRPQTTTRKIRIIRTRIVSLSDRSAKYLSPRISWK